MKRQIPKQTFRSYIKINRIDSISWCHLNASYVLGNKIAKNRESQFNDLGKPQFFYEVVQYWVAFELVQVLQKFGLNPEFKTNLNRWSNDMHWVVRKIVCGFRILPSDRLLRGVWVLSVLVLTFYVSLFERWRRGAF